MYIILVQYDRSIRLVCIRTALSQHTDTFLLLVPSFLDLYLASLPYFDIYVLTCRHGFSILKLNSTISLYTRRHLCREDAQILTSDTQERNNAVFQCNAAINEIKLREHFFLHSL